jgi:hypothetical protein
MRQPAKRAMKVLWALQCSLSEIVEPNKAEVEEQGFSVHVFSIFSKRFEFCLIYSYVERGTNKLFLAAIMDLSHQTCPNGPI